jgi:hypothetical protein
MLTTCFQFDPIHQKLDFSEATARNALLERSTRTYLAFINDNYVFTEMTGMSLLLEKMIWNNFHVTSFEVWSDKNMEATELRTMQIDNGELIIRTGFYNEEDDCKVIDLTDSAFIAHVATIKALGGYDQSLPFGKPHCKQNGTSHLECVAEFLIVGESHDLFLRLKEANFRVASCDGSRIQLIQHRALLNHIAEFDPFMFQKLLKKHSLDRMLDSTGIAVEQARFNLFVIIMSAPGNIRQRQILRRGLSGYKQNPLIRCERTDCQLKGK